MAQDSSNRDTKESREDTNRQAPELEHVMCVNSCGFFGSTATLSMCSKCYKEFVLKQTRGSSAKSAERVSPLTIHGESLAACERKLGQREGAQSSSVISELPEEQGETDTGLLSSGSGRPPPSRCFSCRKNLGLTGFVKCRCGNTFCSLHRYSDEHNCPYDYRKNAQEAIAKANPVVKGDKLNRM